MSGQRFACREKDLPASTSSVAMFAEVRLASVPAHVSCLEPCLSSPLGSHQPWDLQRDGEIDGRLMRGLMGKAGTGQSLAVKTSALGIEESQKSSVTSAP